MIRCFRFLSLAIAISIPALAVANHIDLIQDDSNPGNGVSNATFSLTSSNSTAAVGTQIGESADILGGSRTVTVVRNEGFGQSISAQKVAGTNCIEVLNGNVSAGNVTLDYDGFENLDFDTLYDRIDINIPLLSNSTGDGEFDVFLSVFSSAGNGTATSGRIEASVTGGSTVLSFNFNNAAFSSVNFLDVDRVTVLFDTAIIGTDFRIGAITREADAVPIPEPNSLILLGIVCIASICALRVGR